MKFYLSYIYYTIIYYGLILLVIIAAFDQGGRDLAPLTVITGVNLTLLLILFLKKAREKKFIFPFSPLLLLMSSFILLGFISIFYSIDKWVSIYEFVKILNYMSIFLIIINNFESPGEFKKLGFLYLLWLLSLAIFGIGQYIFGMGGVPLAIGSRASTLYVTPTAFATNLIFVIFMVVTFFLLSEKKRLFWWISLVILYLALLATYSRSGWLVFLGCLLWLAYLMRRAKLKISFRRSIQLVTILVMSSLIFFFHNLLFMKIPAQTKASFQERLESISRPLESPNVLNRLRYWESSLKIIRKHPWGTGIGTYHLIYPSVKHRSLKGFTHYYAHNDYLQIFSEMGILAFFIWLGIIFSYFKMGLALIDYYGIKDDRFNLTIIIACLVSGFGLFIMSFLDFPFYLPGLMLPLFICFGIVVLSTYEVKPYANSFLALDKLKFFSPLKRKTLQIMGVIFYLIFLTIILRPYIAQVYTQQGKDLLQTQRFPQAIVKFEKALKFCPWAANYHANLGYAYGLFERLGGQISRTKVIDVFLKAIELSKYNVENYELLGDYLIMGPSREEKIEGLYFLSMASKLNPVEDIYNLKQGLVYLELGMYKEAIEQLLIFKAANPLDLFVRLKLAQSYWAERREKEARAELEFLISKDPENQEALALLKKISLEER